MAEVKDTVSKSEFEKLEKVVDSLAEQIKKLADNQKAVKSSITVQEPTPKIKLEKPAPFELKGKGKVQFQFARIEVALTEGTPLTLVVGDELAKDPELAARVYEAAPYLFTILK